MGKIKKFDTFIGENIAISQHLTPTNITSQVDPYIADQQKQAQQFVRLQNILMGVFASQTSGMNKADDLDFEVDNLKVVRIFRNTNGSLDVHLRFESEEVPFYGAFYNWASPNGATFKCEYMDAKRFSQPNRIRFEGILMNTLHKWFKPREGRYTALKNIDLYDSMGKLVTIPEAGKVVVEEVLTEENKPTIYLSYMGQELYISDLDFYYFHWWFDAPVQKKFYF